VRYLPIGLAAGMIALLLTLQPLISRAALHSRDARAANSSRPVATYVSKIFGHLSTIRLIPLPRL
jgi:hypothetical protein